MTIKVLISDQKLCTWEHTFSSQCTKGAIIVYVINIYKWRWAGYYLYKSLKEMSLTLLVIRYLWHKRQIFFQCHYSKIWDNSENWIKWSASWWAEQTKHTIGWLRGIYSLLDIWGLQHDMFIKPEMSQHLNADTWISFCFKSPL